MKITILSFAFDSFSIKRLRQACARASLKVQLLDANSVAMHCDSSGLKLFSNNHPIDLPEILLSRLGAASFPVGVAIVRQIEQLGVRTVNSWRSIAMTRDKFLTMQILGTHKIPIPPTAFISLSSDLAPAIERLGGSPVILKLTRGTQGIGVMLAETVKSAEAIFETMQLTHKQVLVQKFIAESKGQDVRAFIVGQRVVAAMRRIAKNDEFRSNFHRGGKVEALKLPLEYEKVALKAAETLGLEIAGVDILESDNGPLIMELNSSPGLEGIESASKVDVAGAIIEHLKELKAKL